MVIKEPVQMLCVSNCIAQSRRNWKLKVSLPASIA